VAHLLSLVTLDAFASSTIASDASAKRISRLLRSHRLYRRHRELHIYSEKRAVNRKSPSNFAKQPRDKELVQLRTFTTAFRGFTRLVTPATQKAIDASIFLDANGSFTAFVIGHQNSEASKTPEAISQR
jgi:hypothetical protein